MTGWDEAVEAYEQVFGDDCTLDMAAWRIVAALDTGCLMVSRLAWAQEAAAIIRQRRKALGAQGQASDYGHHPETGDALLWLALRMVALAGQSPESGGSAVMALLSAERTLRVWWARQQPGRDL